MRHEVKYGESPTLIAHAYRVPFESLISANPHKPTKIVNGRTTWESLLPRETIIVPTGGMVGDAVADTLNALVHAGSPCLQANVALVCDAQSALGFVPGNGVDGKWGTNAAAKAKAHGFTIPGCSPRPSWWTPAGQTNCVAGPAPLKPGPSVNLAQTANAALVALKMDPNYCTNVAKAGTAVNTAVHNFKAAWNAANPSNPVPIGTGKYEPVVASALSSALGGGSVPPGCGAAAPAPTPSTQPAPTPAPSSTPAPTPEQGPTAPAVPLAVRALLSFDPCLQENAALVCQAQSALGFVPGNGVDGKWGANASARAKALGVNVPACSPRPAWWAPAGYSNCPGAPPAPSAGGSASGKAAGDAAAAAASAAKAAADTAAKAAADATTQDQADKAAAAAKAASDAATAAAAKAAAAGDAAAAKIAADAAAAAKAASDAANKSAGGGDGAIVAPEKKGLSTGAIVAGALGAAALLGLVAVAATGKKGAHGARGARGPRGRKPAHRKHAHKKPAHHKRKATKKKRR